MAKLHPFWWFVPPEVIYEMFGGSGHTTVYSRTEGFYHIFGYGAGQIVDYEASWTRMPFDGKFETFLIKSDVSPNDIVATSIQLIVRKNGVDTSLAVTLTGDQTEGSDETHEVTFVKGDYINIHYVAPGAEGDSTVCWGCKIVTS